MILLGVAIGIYSLAFFIPTILLDYGYTAVKAQVYSIPPGICGITLSLLFAFLADKYNHRFSFAIIAITLAISGFAMAGWAISSPGARYAGLFLAYMGPPPPHHNFANLLTPR
jgi:cyanate permease